MKSVQLKTNIGQNDARKLGVDDASHLLEGAIVELEDETAAAIVKRRWGSIVDEKPSVDEKPAGKKKAKAEDAE